MSDRYAGLAGLSVSVVDGAVVVDVSTPERPQHTRFRIDPATALDLADALTDAVDRIDS